MSNLLIRTATGAVFLAVMIGAMILGEYVLLGVFTLIVFFSLTEYFKLIKKYSQPIEIPAIVCYVGIFLAVQFLPDYLFFPLLVSSAVPLIMTELFRKNDQQLIHALTVSFPLLWIVIPMAMLVRVGLQPVQNQEPWKLLLPYFILLWVNDTFAYLGGKLLGKHKLFPRISAGKTIEGTLIGILFTLIAGCLIFLWLGIFPVWKWTIAAVIIAPVAVASDLFESAIKRKAEVKDSGNILPGHGGMLDRFDSVFFSSPIYYLIIHW